MPAIKTAGVHSCAVIALGNFKQGDQYELNEEYLKDTNPDKLNNGKYKITEDMYIQNFYDDILYPTSQPLGGTAVYPFDLVMDYIDESGMVDKIIIANLADFQFHYRDNYWPKRLEARGFNLVEKTDNDIGGINYFYIRNKGRVPIKEGERLLENG